MAFMDKLGQVANKVANVAGDTVDFSKAKGKILIEKNKIKEVKESIGEFVYQAVLNDEEVDVERLKAFCAEIDEHLAEIEKLAAEAKASGQNISDAWDGVTEDIKGAVAAGTAAYQNAKAPKEEEAPVDPCEGCENESAEDCETCEAGCEEVKDGSEE